MLEVEKLLEAQQAARKSAAGEVELTKFASSVEPEPEPEEVPDETPPEENTDPDSTGNSDEEPAEDPDASGEESEEKENVAEAMESLRNPPEIATEGIDEILHYSSAAANGLINAVKYIAMLGIRVTPKVASVLYKGFIVTASFVIKHLFKSIYLVDKFIERRANSIDNLKQGIAALRASIEEIKKAEPKSLEGQSFTNTKIINDLKIRDSVDFSANIGVLTSFVEDVMVVSDKGFKNDMASLSYVISSVGNSKVSLPDSSLTLPEFKDCVKQELDNGMEIHQVNKVLPGDRLFSITLPKELSYNEMESVLAGYSRSSISLTVGKDFESVDLVPYMDVETLSGFVDSLEGLVSGVEKHNKYFEELKSQKLRMRFGFRDYIKACIADAGGRTIKESLIGLVKAKTTFIDKVYVVGMIDVQDYIAATVSSGIRFSKENIKRLQ